MKNISICITLFLLVTSTMGWSQGELDNYLETSAENNPGLKAKFNDYMSAVQKVPQVRGLPDPVLAFGYFISPLETRVGPQKFKASLTQVFPWFGTLTESENASTELANSKLELFEEAKSKLFYDVKSAYYNLYYIQKGIDITNENMDILNIFKQLALIKFEAGKASAVDEIRIEMEIADLENQLAYMIDSKYQMQVQFNNLINVETQSQIVIPDSLWEDELAFDRTQLLDSIIAQNHSIKQIEHRILSWESQESSSRKKGGPNFILGLDYTAVGKSGNPNIDPGEDGKDAWLIKAGITIPLYRNKYNGLVAEATYQIETGGFEKADKKNQLSSLFEVGYKDFKDGERRIKLFENQLKLSKKALDILLAEYSTDSKNFEEVLRMERKVLNYGLEMDKAKIDKNAAVAFIDYLLGN